MTTAAKVSEPTVTFAAAFIKLQGEIKPAIKDAENAAFKQGNRVSKYADLGAVWDAIKEPLKANNFGILQFPQYEGETMYLETVLMHVSGECMVSKYPLRPTKQDPQGFGSALTYARRYSISAILGVVADIDDDGNAASGTPAPKPKAVSREEKGDALDKARSWANDAIREINGMAADEVNTWTTKNAPAMVKLRAIDQDTHAELMKAIQAVGE